MFLVVFVAREMVMVTCFGSVLFPPFQHVRELPEFAYLLSLNRSNWPRCLLWHGWLPGFSGLVIRTPGLPPLEIWRLFILSGALVLILLTLVIAGLLLSIGMLMILLWRCLNILISGLMGAGKTFLLWVGLRLLVLVCTFLLLSLLLRVRFGERRKSYGDARLERCRIFLPVPGVMQTVQRAEFWGAVLAMQAYWPCHLGIDNLHVARSIGRLLDCGSLDKPLPLVKDGDLIALVQYMIRTRGRETVRVT